MRAFNKNLVPNPSHHGYPNIDILEKPLHIEIGCGVGRHPILWSQQHPQQTLLAIEKSPMRFRKFNDQLQTLAIKNIIPIQSNAISFITHHIPLNSVQHYFLLYPNPYPKEGQANKRWHNMPFMQHVLDTLIPGGQIHLATNMAFYAKEAEHMMQTQWQCKIVERHVYNKNNLPSHYHTHFEEKYIVRGENCYHLIFQKNN